MYLTSILGVASASVAVPLYIKVNFWLNWFHYSGVWPMLCYYRPYYPPGCYESKTFILLLSLSIFLIYLVTSLVFSHVNMVSLRFSNTYILGNSVDSRHNLCNFTGMLVSLVLLQIFDKLPRGLCSKNIITNIWHLLQR